MRCHFNPFLDFPHIHLRLLTFLPLLRLKDRGAIATHGTSPRRLSHLRLPSRCLGFFITAAAFWEVQRCRSAKDKCQRWVLGCSCVRSSSSNVHPQFWLALVAFGLEAALWPVGLYPGQPHCKNTLVLEEFLYFPYDSVSNPPCFSCWKIPALASWTKRHKLSRGLMSQYWAVDADSHRGFTARAEELIWCVRIPKTCLCHSCAHW